MNIYAQKFRLSFLGLVLFLISTLNATYGQCPTNIGFEENSFNQWTGYTGIVNITWNWPTMIATPGIVAGRHTVTSIATGNDPCVGASLPQKCPIAGFGLYSARLGGNCTTGAQGERLSTTMYVTASNSALIFAIASVIQNPGLHAPSEMPRSEVSLMDSLGNPLQPGTCTQFVYIAGDQNLPFRNGPVCCANSVQYLPWTLYSADLSAYIGQTITIEARNGDCTLGGHFAVTYVDFRCDVFQITTRYCPGDPSVILNAPTGFTNYLWSPSGATSESIVVLNPILDSVHVVTITPWTGPTCAIVLYDTIRRMDITSSFTPVTCRGGSDGTGTGIPINGSPNFLYTWSTSPIQTTQTATGLRAGSYVVSITDATGCRLLDTVNITQPLTSVSSTLSMVQISCFGGSNGTATVVGSGGSSPLTYSWNTAPVQTTTTATGLSTGYYTVTVTDSVGCTKRDSILVTQPTQLTVTTTFTPVSCNGGSNGSMTALTSGGISPYTYSWNTTPIQNTVSAVNVPAGNYTVTVRDYRLCQTQGNVIVTEPSALTATFSSTLVTCANGNNGTATATGSGGQSPYIYIWNSTPVQINQTATGLSVTTYLVTVTDANNCAQTYSVPISSISPLTATVTSTPVSCQGGSDGTATVVSSGGTPGYSYTWNTSPVQTGITATGLQLGPYQVTVTDANNCTFTRAFNITQVPVLQVGFTYTAIRCFGGNDGTITAQPTGGNPGYTYVWSTIPTQNVQTATGLSIGSYNVTVTDTRGCTITRGINLPQPTQLVGTITMTPITCAGQSNGTMTAIVNGGTPGYTYLWNTTPPQSNQTAVALPVGWHSIIISDANNCTLNLRDSVYTLSELFASTTNTEVSCFGGSDGTATGSGIGGTIPYQYRWTTVPVQNTQQATGLTAGSYILKLTDANSCVKYDTTYVLEPPQLIGSTSSTSVSCYGGTNGTMDVSVSGGTPGYNYSWNTIPVQTTSLATGVPGGNYTVTIRDSRNCTLALSQNVPEPSRLQSSTSFTQPLCLGDANGTATAQGINATPPYTYSWNTLPVQNTQTATGLIAGTYQVTIIDNNLCSRTSIVNVTNPSRLILSMSGIDLTCAQPQDNGIGSVLAIGGTPPYTYSWPVGNNPNQAYNTGMPAGTWTVQVMDSHLCTETGNVILHSPVFPVAHTYPDTFVCEGSGGVPLGSWGTGGIAPYTYVWIPNNGSLQNPNLQNPIANPDTTTVYYVRVIDAAGCSSGLVPQKIVVNEIPLVYAGPDTTYCKNGPAVFLEASILNPVGSYDIQWQPSTLVYCDTCLTTYTTPDTTTIYTVWIRSRLTGCESQRSTLDSRTSVVVNVKPRPIADAGPDTTICAGASATLCGVATGAGPNYTYKWSPSQNLASDITQCVLSTPPFTIIYTLVVTSDGCESLADSVTVFVATIPVVDAGNIKNICENDSVSLDGQVQLGLAQIFRWTPSLGLNDSTQLQPIASPAVTTWYLLQGINDGCYGPWDSVQVIVHSVPRAEAGNDTTICSGAALRLNGSYTGGEAPVWMKWTPALGLSNTGILNPISSPSLTTMYYLETWSGTGTTVCRSRDSMLITVMPGVIATLNADTNALCPGQSTQLWATGGIGGASFAWSPQTGLSGNVSNHLTATPRINTTYQVIVSEAGCSDTASVEIRVHPEPVANFLQSQPEGCGNVNILFNDRSDNAVSWLWNFGDNTEINNENNPWHTYTQNGTYTVQLIIRGIGGCLDTFTSNLPITIRDAMSINVISDPPVPSELVMPASEVKFEDYTPGATQWQWIFGDGSTGIGQSITHRYVVAGIYKVSIEITDEYGCKLSKEIGPYIVKGPEVDIPNVFSPNGDNVNDFFQVGYTGDEIFLLQIYDRWGVKYFESRNKNQGWDGTDFNGSPAQHGTYFYVVKIGENSYGGKISLVR